MLMPIAAIEIRHFATTLATSARAAAPVRPIGRKDPAAPVRPIERKDPAAPVRPIERRDPAAPVRPIE